MHLPAELSEAIEREVTGIAPRDLAAAAQTLTLRYGDGGERGSAGSSKVSSRCGKPEHRGKTAPRGMPLGENAMLAAYAVVRMPATYAAASAALAALAERAPGLGPESLLDLGAGLGAASWAAGEVFPTLARASLLERDAAAIAMGRRFMQCAEAAFLRQGDWRACDLAVWSAQIQNSGFSDSIDRTDRTDLTQPAISPASSDLVIFSYSLGEVAERARGRVLERAWAAAEQALVVVEPGTPAGFGVVAAARAALIEMGGAVAAPCPHNAGCPMQGGAAWCHFAQRLARSRRHRLAKGGDLGWEDEKFSYAAVVKDRALLAPGPGARIISTPHVSKGGVMLPLCAPSGLLDTAIPRRNSAAYKRAKKANWGDWWE